MFDILKICGLNIRQYRKAKGLTLSQISRSVGITGAYLGYIERGQRNLSLLTISKIADALEIQPYHLLMKNEDDFDRALHSLNIMLITRRKVNQVVFLNEVLLSYLKSDKN